ncbi:UDP-glucuronosyltransferase 2B15-like [Trichoplusia ni]|uniref:UDP-glucuronosyltransferase n=1 Tax=Trichoplusia ni TaxID=7111 RepID=A0A7E5W4E9_TRINI|nr:UDP-glucuronosyltransferase 2B15-like [Trichoplusia ni]
MKWTLLLLTLFLNDVFSYKILVAFPYPGKSHSILGEGFVRHLLNGGHEVTYITPVPIKKPHPNLRQVDVSSNFENFVFTSTLDFKKVMNKEVDLKDMFTMYHLMLKVAEKGVNHKNVQKLIMDPSEQFDLVIAEWLYQHLYSGFATVFNCPYAWSSSMEPHPMVLDLIDEIGNPAYFADHMSPLTPPLSFSERVSELLNVIYLYRIRWSVSDAEAKAYEKGFGPAVAKRGLRLPAFDEVKFNGSIMFGNSHVSLGEAHRVPMNYVPIAGYHINEETQPLPENLQKIMDNAPHGVIYFSMGTMMPSKTMPMEFKRAFLDMFSTLKYTVIWKLEEEFKDLPKNVHVVQWAPQPSILAHPNCKLFISHGGLLSTTETVHYGVPIIGVPLFADQFMNVLRAIRKGFALQVDLGFDTPAKLKVAIGEILGDPKYANKVKELSYIYHNRLNKPGDLINWWVEHVIETRGAVHLRSPALHVPFYQKLYLDLIALILLGLVVVIRMLKKLISGRNETKQKKN